jgi:hypothetical protein
VNIEPYISREATASELRSLRSILIAIAIVALLFLAAVLALGWLDSKYPCGVLGAKDPGTGECHRAGG